jgi:histidyl-tRNA synthetase
MPAKFKAPRGTFDVLPEQQAVRRRIAHVASRRLEAAGYGRMDTPIFEETDLFARRTTGCSARWWWPRWPSRWCC